MRSHPILRGYIAVLLCSLIACLPASAGTIVYKEGNTIVFNPSTTIAGINVGAQAADPSAPVNGDIWYKTGTGFRIRTEGTTVTIGAGGGGGSGDALTTDPLSQFAATTSAQLKGVLSDELGDASGKAIFALGTLAISSGKTLTSSNTLTLAGTDGSTLNIGAGGTLGAAALLGTSAGGNGTADNGKAAIFGTGGIFDATTEITVHNAANAAHAYLSDDGTIGFHAVGETNPRELAFPSDVLEGESKEIATKNWVNAQGFATSAASLSAAQTFTGQNTFSLSPRVSRTDLSGGTALAVGTHYYDTLSSIRTLTFSGTPADGDLISLHLTVTGGPHVLTIPTSYRTGSTSTVTTVTLPTGNHWLNWSRINTSWKLTDNAPDAEAAYSILANATGSSAIPAFTDSPVVANLTANTAIEVGNASDTTLARASAGNLTVEGNALYRAGGTDVPVADGGTGVSSLTAYAPIFGGTTSTGAVQSGTVGTAGQVLTSNGAGALPTFQAAAGGSGYTLQTEYQSSFAWADASTYYAGADDFASSTYNTERMVIPKTGTLKAICVRVSYTAGTSETVTFYARHNDTTDVGSLTLTMNTGTIAYANDFAVNQAVTQGDYIALKVATPTWVTNPTTCRMTATFYFE